MPFVPPPSSGQVIASTWGAAVANQVVTRFTNAAQRTSQLTSPVLNQLTARDDAPGVLEYWNGTAWVPFRGASEEYTYAQATVGKAVTATVESSADLVVAAPAVTFDGVTPIVVELFTPGGLAPNVAGAVLYCLLYQDGVSLGRMGAILNNAAVTLVTPMLMRRRLTPTAGSHTFSFAAIVSGGTGNVQAGAGGVGAYMPAYIRILRA